MTESLAAAGQSDAVTAPRVDATTGHRTEASGMPDRLTTAARAIADHRDRVARLVHRLLGWSVDTEDVVQDVLVTALAAVHRFRGHASIATWITRIAINTCRRHHRRRTVRAWLRGQPYDAVGEPPAAPDRTDPDDADKLVRVRRAIRHLRPKYREVVVLWYLEDMPTDAVARVLGVSRGTVETRLTRARRSLKHALADFAEV
ncbi:MAG: RNA polymerase sigma factor [Phycisphaerae bacterium]